MSDVKTECWLLDQNSPLKGWQHGGVLAFSNGAVDGLGPRHVTHGHYRIVNDVFDAEGNVRPVAANYTFDEREGRAKKAPDLPVRNHPGQTMFRNAGDHFTLLAKGIRPTEDLIVGDIWDADRPSVRYLFRMTRLCEIAGSAAGRCRSRQDRLDLCHDMIRSTCAGEFDGLPIESLHGIRSSHNWQADAA